MLIQRFFILATLSLAMMGCGEMRYLPVRLWRETPGEMTAFPVRSLMWKRLHLVIADCLLVLRGAHRDHNFPDLGPGGDALLEVTLSNLRNVDIVCIRASLSSSSQAIRFSEPSLYVYGILSNQSLAMATSLELGTEVESGESIEFIASITHLGCDEAAGDESGEQYCEEITESYRFSWRVGDALAAPGL